TLVALKLARALQAQKPASQIVISVTTSTGFALARTQCEPWMEVIYNPLDTAAIVNAALASIRPAQLIFVEGELWPNLLVECSRRQIPTSVVDARLSPRSERRFRRFKRWISPVLRLLNAIHVTDEEEAQRWLGLGVDPARVHRVGSIKFDEPPVRESTRAHQFRALLEAHGVAPDAPILLGGSTWDPEESVLAGIASGLRAKFPGLCLIIVPRHVERTPEIVRKLSNDGHRVVRRSTLTDATAGSPAAPRLNTLLVDTTGELRDWYELATIAFVGKSLRAHGGQNPAEPAALGKPILFGPHMENFAALAGKLVRDQGAEQVANATDLHRAIQHLLESPDERTRRGGCAMAAVSAHRGAAARSAALLLKPRRPE
ncbi:MAG TPA: glycosyltransferase N-terminal domain-containing protein, partial [Chthoniobacteraceae bacterium]|nr:glycosyltransferase N-terminal domain-containing protein [Chthoniobacteraceae bacterium]